jgi:hypothetical protein
VFTDAEAEVPSGLDGGTLAARASIEAWLAFRVATSSPTA